MYRFIFKFLIIVLFFNCSFSYSLSENPVDCLRNINRNILSIMENNIHLSEDKLNEVVGSYIISHINFNEMCLWIVGKSLWRSISIDKQNDFINEFKKLVLKTYSITLNKYIKYNVIFFPNNNFDIKNIKQNCKIQISSEIEILEGGKNLHVDYRLIFIKNSWQLYDLIIEGVSILKGFQAQFSNDIKKNGIDFIINKIKQHNL